MEYRCISGKKIKPVKFRDYKKGQVISMKEKMTNDCIMTEPEENSEENSVYIFPQKPDVVGLVRAWIGFNFTTFLEELKNFTAVIMDENKEQKEVNAYTYYVNFCKRYGKRVEVYRFEIIINILNTCRRINWESPVTYLYNKYIGDIYSDAPITGIPLYTQKETAQS